MSVKRDRDILSGLQITWTSPYKETAVFNNTVPGKIGICINFGHNFGHPVYIPVETLLRIMNDLMSGEKRTQKGEIGK